MQIIIVPDAKAVARYAADRIADVIRTRAVEAVHAAADAAGAAGAADVVADAADANPGAAG